MDRKQKFGNYQTTIFTHCSVLISTAAAAVATNYRRPLELPEFWRFGFSATASSSVGAHTIAGLQTHPPQRWVYGAGEMSGYSGIGAYTSRVFSLICSFFFSF